jgi:hypothetical protein
MADEMEEQDYGHAVEEDVRQIVAKLGVSDFVYTVPLLARGSGSREVGDALLISNGLGAVLQVKSRDPDGRAEDGATWLASRGERAYRQGKGSLRSIANRRAAGETIHAIPVRAASWSDADRELARLSLDMDVSDWPIIVIVDHPSLDGVSPLHDDAFWITTTDWLWLNQALRSVTAVLT